MPNKKKRRSSTKGQKKKARSPQKNASWMSAGMDGSDRQQSISRSTLYDEYKRATTRFKEGLVSLVPTLGPRVHDLVVASDSLAEQTAEAPTAAVPINLLRTLRSAIRIRQRVALLYDRDSGGDPGHVYFIQVLQYCYHRLKPLVRNETPKQQQTNKSDAEGDASLLTNKFEALSTNEHDDDVLEEDDDDTAWEEESVERPQEPETEYLIDDLIEGSDSFFATAFLGTINSLLEEVAASYANLKSMCRQKTKESPLIGFELMKCGVVCSEALQELRYAEQVFVAERPHLDTLYRILGTILFPDTINLLASEMNGTDKREMHRAATICIGDCLCIQVMNQQYGGTEIWFQKIVDFANKWQVNANRVCRICAVPIAMISVELGHKTHEFVKGSLDISMENINAALVGEEIMPDAWLPNMTHLTGKRSVVRTFYYIEKFLMKSNHLDTPIEYIDKELGWHNLSPDGSKLDTEILGRNFLIVVMAELVERCGWGSWKYFLPSEDRLFPMIRIFREFISSQQAKCPISLSFVFVMHMLMIAVIELQGDNDLQKVSLAGKVSMLRFLDDFDDAIARPNPFMKDYKDHMLQTHFANNLTTTREGSLIDLVYWNPCVAGMTILYTIYTQNVGMGCYELDVIAQLKTLLHLAHALEERGMSLEEFPFVCRLEELFGKAKTVWAVPKPRRGNFARHYWLAIGMRPDVATKLAIETTLSVQGTMYTLAEDYSLSRRSDKNKLSKVALTGENVSPSFRNLILADFTPYTQASEDEDSLDHFRHRVSETLANMERDRELLCLHLPTLNADMFDFYEDLIGRDSIAEMEKVHAITLQYTVSAILSMFDTMESIDERRGQRIVSIMAKHFGREATPKNKYSYFL